MRLFRRQHDHTCMPLSEVAPVTQREEYVATLIEMLPLGLADLAAHAAEAVELMDRIERCLGMVEVDRRRRAIIPIVIRADASNLEEGLERARATFEEWQKTAGAGGAYSPDVIVEDGEDGERPAAGGDDDDGPPRKDPGPESAVAAAESAAAVAHEAMNARPSLEEGTDEPTPARVKRAGPICKTCNRPPASREHRAHKQQEAARARPDPIPAETSQTPASVPPAVISEAEPSSTEPDAGPAPHRHNYTIAPPEGPISWGVCSTCDEDAPGHRKAFGNSEDAIALLSESLSPEEVERRLYVAPEEESA